MKKLTLIVLPPAFGMRNSSTFCEKAEALIAYSGLPYERQIAMPNKGPRGKLPVLKDGNHIIPDSTHIQRYLETKYGIDFDGKLNAEQYADSEAYRRLGEEHLNWTIVYSRYYDNPEEIKRAFFAKVPSMFRGFIYKMVKKSVDKNLNGHGMGRHTAEEIYDFGKRDLEAVAAKLGNKSFLLGDSVASVDASIYPLILAIVDPPLKSPLKNVIQNLKTLEPYARRAEQAFFGRSKEC
jgi:glutathione S-transferase